MNLLAGDIGGTKTLLGVYKWNDEPVKIHQKKYISKEWSSLELIITDYIKTLPNNINEPRFACLALAGPVSNGSCKLTNLEWDVNYNDICKSLGFRSLELINDICAHIYAIPYLKPNQFIDVQEGKKNINEINKGSIALIASGTGLGIARGFLQNNRIHAMPSEGGHKEFAPRSEKEWEVCKWIKSDLNLERLSIERVISGTGLGNIARWRLSKPDAISHPLKDISENWNEKNFHEHDLPALASKAAKNGDLLMEEVLEIWLSGYGSAAGDLALQELCHCGLWIAGGTTPKHINGIRSTTFLENMRNKGRFKDFLSQIPVMAIIDPEAGLFGAACRAHMIAESSEKLI